MKEADWQQQVIDLAYILGWRHLHIRRSIGRGTQWTTSTNIKGWPDLLLWNLRDPKRGLVALELKGEKTRVDPEQLVVLAELEAAGVRTMIARPSDLDAVRDLLAAKAEVVA